MAQFYNRVCLIYNLLGTTNPHLRGTSYFHYGGVVAVIQKVRKSGGYQGRWLSQGFAAMNEFCAVSIAQSFIRGEILFGRLAAA